MPRAIAQAADMALQYLNLDALLQLAQQAPRLDAHDEAPVAENGAKPARHASACSGMRPSSSTIRKISRPWSEK